MAGIVSVQAEFQVRAMRVITFYVTIYTSFYLNPTNGQG